MKKMVYGFAALAVLGLSLASACGDDTSEPDNSVANNSVANNSNNSVSNNSTSNNSGTNNGPTWQNGVAEIFEERCSRCHMWTLDYALVTVETEHLRYKIEHGHGDMTEEELVEVGIWFDNDTPLK